MADIIAKIDNFSITQFVDIEYYSRKTGFLEFKIEEPQDLTLTGGETTTNNTGKNGRIILIKKSDKTFAGSGTNGVISAGLMATQTGGDITTGTYTIKKSEIAEAQSGKITTEAVAVGTAGAEIGEISVLAGNKAVLDTYKQATVADATHFAYDPETKEITLPVSAGEPVIADGSQVRFSYIREVTGTKVTDPSDKFSGTGELWIHCFGMDSCDNEYFAAIVVPRCSFTGEFELSLGGDQTTQNFNFTALADTCKSGGNLFELIVYTDEE